MRDCDVPIIAAIEGNCMGGGLEIAACCDIRLAEENARFGAPIAKLGFPMAPREMALIAEALGPHLARSLLLQAAVLPAQRLWHSGFLLDCVPKGELQACLQTRLAELLPLSPQAARLNKQTLRRLQAPAPPSDGPDASVWAYGYADSAEHREGIAAFLDKRAAAFSQYER
jgi:enoyl-CoA hydratase/carnithine racemase